MTSPPRRASEARRDACLWGVLSAAVLVSIPVGFVSADGLGQAVRASTGRWALNPNHLPLEPLNALALSATSLVAPEGLAVDRLSRPRG